MSPIPRRRRPEFSVSWFFSRRRRSAAIQTRIRRPRDILANADVFIFFYRSLGGPYARITCPIRMNIIMSIMIKYNNEYNMTTTMTTTNNDDQRVEAERREPYVILVVRSSVFVFQGRKTHCRVGYWLAETADGWKGTGTARRGQRALAAPTSFSGADPSHTPMLLPPHDRCMLCACNDDANAMPREQNAIVKVGCWTSVRAHARLFASTTAAAAAPLFHHTSSSPPPPPIPPERPSKMAAAVHV